MKTYLLLALSLIAGCGARFEPGGSTGALGEGAPTQSGSDAGSTDAAKSAPMEDIGFICDTPGFYDYDSYVPPLDSEADAPPPDSGAAVDTQPEDGGPSPAD